MHITRHVHKKHTPKVVRLKCCVKTTSGRGLNPNSIAITRPLLRMHTTTHPIHTNMYTVIPLQDTRLLLHNIMHTIMPLRQSPSVRMHHCRYDS